MLFQISIVGFEWILGLAIMFGFALFFTVLIEGSTKEFFVFLTLFNGFVVWSGLLELYTLILNIIVLCIIILLEYNKGRMI